MGAWRPLTAMMLLAAAAGCIQADDAPEATDEAPRDDDAPSAAPMPICEPNAPPSGSPGVGPSQGGVSNEPGSFSYGGQTAGKTGTEQYFWENPSGAAQVSWGGQAVVGSLRLTVRDACGVEVYEKEDTGPSQGGEVESTRRAQPGAWLLTFEFTGYTAQMGLAITSA